MKTLSRTIITVLLLLSSSCETLDVLDGRGRGDGYDVLPELKKEEIYYAAVEFPPGYDWHRDSLAGSSAGIITLYRNHLRFLSFAFGPDKRISSDPDTHYLMGGKLYTQYSTADSTYIKCNGRSFLQFAGREYIKGMLLRRNDFWTIGQLRDAEGFNLRCNGRVVGRRDNGTLFGDMVSNPHQALYEDNDKLCYCYKENLASTQSSFSVIEDSEYGGERGAWSVLDQIVMNDFPRFVCSKDSMFSVYDGLAKYNIPELENVRDCYIFPCQDKLYMAGTIISADGSSIDFLSCDREVRLLQAGKLLYAYPCGNGVALLCRDETGMVLELPDTSVSVSGEYRAYTRNTVWTDGKKWLWALNPTDLAEKASIKSSSENRELELYGFVSCVEITTTQ